MIPHNILFWVGIFYTVMFGITAFAHLEKDIMNKSIAFPFMLFAGAAVAKYLGW